MKITRNNYEEYFLDFADGKLNPAMREEFERFLKANPDLDAELGEFENFSVAEDSEIKFNKKSSLKKTFIAVGGMDENNYENFLIGKLEHDLNREELNNLESFIKENPFVGREHELFKKTILIPDKGIVFQNKAELKKTLIIPLLWKRAASAIAIAASILLLLYFNFRKESIYTEMKNEIVLGNNEVKNKLQAAGINSAEEKLSSLGQSAGVRLADRPSKEKIIRHKEKPITVQEAIERDQLTADNGQPLINNSTLVADEEEQTEKFEIISGNNPVKINRAEEFLSENINKNSVSENNAESQPAISAEDIIALDTDKPEGNQPQAISYQGSDDSFSFREFLAFSFRKNVLKEKVAKKKKDEKINPVDFASAAVRGVSRLFGSKIQLKKNYKDNGELASVSFISPQLEISQTVHRK